LIRNGKSHGKIGYAVIRNTKFVGAVVTLKLRFAQEVQ